MISEEFWSWYDAFAAPRLEGRSDTFRKMFKHLDSYDRPVHIVETGCVEDPDNWRGNGCSTLLFDRYAHCHPGSTVRSVDIVPGKVRAARDLVNGSTELFCGDSVKVMAEWAQDLRTIDLAYLDASDLKWLHPVPSAQHHLNELMAVMPALEARSMVAVDDSPAAMDEFPSVRVSGKGEFVARYAFSVGADLAFLEYQAGWTGLTREPNREPESIEEIIARARRHIEEDRLVAADPLYRLVLYMTPPPYVPRTRVARGEACVFFAKLALKGKRYGVAAEWYKQALAADPAAVEYRVELATKCCLPLGMMEVAVTEVERALEIEPDNGAALQALGGLEHERCNLGRAVAAYDKAIAVRPEDPSAALDRATVALDLADYPLVRELCQRAMGSPREADALHFLAMTEYREGRHEQALPLFDKAIAAGVQDEALAHWHKSLAMESLGLFPEAWAERAWRAKCRTLPGLALPMKRFDRPLWDGEPGPGRIFVHAEAGSGDNLCWVRYFPLIAQRGLDVCCEVMPDMVELVRRSCPDVGVVPRTPFYPDVLSTKSFDSFDWHCPTGHLQWMFRTTTETMPWDGPYLKADLALVEAYRKKLPPGPNIGLCWSSGVRLNDSAWLAEYGRRKSMKFNTLLPVIKRSEARFARFVSLQVGPERGQLGGRFADLLPERPTWDDTAALVECLDLVITVDTAVAHLAGALGKPTWLMMHSEGSWHWMAPRPGSLWNERSPWYPTVRVFRQHRVDQPHYWDEVVADVVEAMSAL